MRLTIEGDAPSQAIASPITRAAPYATGRQYSDRSMIAGGKPSANRTLPTRSAWISWLGRSTRRRAARSRSTCLTEANSAPESSPQATRSAIRQRSERLAMNSGRGMSATAAWNAAAAARSSSHLVELCSPATRVHADQPSTIHRPSRAATGWASRNPRCSTRETSEAIQTACSTSWAGFKTTLSVAQVSPRPLSQVDRGVANLEGRQHGSGRRLIHTPARARGSSSGKYAAACIVNSSA